MCFSASEILNILLLMHPFLTFSFGMSSAVSAQCFFYCIMHCVLYFIIP